MPVTQPIIYGCEIRGSTVDVSIWKLRVYYVVLKAMLCWCAYHRIACTRTGSLLQWFLWLTFDMQRSKKGWLIVGPAWPSIDNPPLPWPSQSSSQLNVDRSMMMCVPVLLCFGVPLFRCSCVPVLLCSGLPVFLCSCKSAPNENFDLGLKTAQPLDLQIATLTHLKHRITNWNCFQVEVPI